MKKFFRVLSFEYINIVRSKVFIFSTLAIIALCAIMVGVVYFMVMSDFDTDDEDVAEEMADTIAVRNESYDSDLLTEVFEEYFDDYGVMVTDESEDEIKARVEDETYALAVIIESPLEFTLINKTGDIYSDYEYTAESAIEYLYRVTAFSGEGLNRETYDAIMNAEVTYTVVNIESGSGMMLIVAMFVMFLLYMAILMYGQLVSSNIVAEKNSRAMELLLSCADPKDFIFGKVIGVGLAGLTQMAVLFALGGVSLGFVNLSGVFGSALQIDMTQLVFTLVFGLVFFIIGFFIYAFLYAALASLASRAEDLNTLTTPIAILYIIAFFVVYFPTALGVTDGVFVTVLSYIPFTAPMEMIVRIACSSVEVYEIVLSLVIQLVFVYLFGRLSAAIYRMGVMMYGKPPKPSEIFRILTARRRADKS